MAIKNFSWNYVGWVDLEDVGFEGTPIDDRYHHPEYLASPMYTLERMARLMDTLGYDALYTTEHHFQPEGIEVIPNPLLACLHLAGITTNLRFGCAFTIVPQWHPLRLAEDYAMVDNLTRGRVIFGVGRGTQTREVETLGAPMLDQEANRDLFEESLEIIMQAFHGADFSHHGGRYSIPPAVPYRTTVLETINVQPKPLYSTDVWQPITSARPRGIENMIRHGIKGVFIPSFVSRHGSAATPGSSIGVPNDSVPALYRETARKAGRDLELGEDLAAYVYCHLGDTGVSAAEEIEPFEQEAFKRIAGIGGGPSDAMIKEMNWRSSGFSGYTMDQLQRLGKPSTARDAATEMGYRPLAERWAKDRGHHLFGPPNEVIATLKELEALYPGMETVILHPPELTHTHLMMEQMERFAREVMPAFPDAIHTGRTWPDRYSDPSAVTRYDDARHLAKS